MTIIESKEITIEKQNAEVMEFLSDLKNYKTLMPARIKSWEVVGDEAEVYIDGLGKYHIGIARQSEHEIVLAPTGKVPVQFEIILNTSDLGQKTEVKGRIEAQLNMMMKMMAQKPLQELIDVQIERLEETLNS